MKFMITTFLIYFFVVSNISIDMSLLMARYGDAIISVLVNVLIPGAIGYAALMYFEKKRNQLKAKGMSCND